MREAVGRQRKSYPGVTLTLTQIEAAERLYQQLRDWHRSLDTLEMLNTQLPGFETHATLLKTTAINGLMSTQIFALVPMAAHVQDVLANVQLETAGPELVAKIADFQHKNKKRENVSFASKFAHFFIDPDRFPMKDSFSTKMVEFHLGTTNCVQTDENVLDESYATFVQNTDRLKERDGMDSISHRRLDRYLWFAGKYRAFLEKPPFEKQKGAEAQPVNDQQETQEEIAKREFLDISDPRYVADLAAVLGN
jgi:hypothetical protein